MTERQAEDGRLHVKKKDTGQILPLQPPEETNLPAPWSWALQTPGLGDSTLPLCGPLSLWGGTVEAPANSRGQGRLAKGQGSVTFTVVGMQRIHLGFGS